MPIICDSDLSISDEIDSDNLSIADEFPDESYIEREIDTITTDIITNSFHQSSMMLCINS